MLFLQLIQPSSHQQWTTIHLHHRTLRRSGAARQERVISRETPTTEYKYKPDSNWPRMTTSARFISTSPHHHSSSLTPKAYAAYVSYALRLETGWPCREDISWSKRVDLSEYLGKLLKINDYFSPTNLHF